MKTYKNLIDFEQLWQITNRCKNASNIDIMDLSNKKTPIEKVEVLK